MTRRAHVDAPPAPRKPGEPHKFKRHLDCRLTSDELHDRSKEAADLMATRDSAEAEYKAAATIGRTEVAGHDVNLRRLARIVRDGVEARPVECEARIVGGNVEVERLDTGEVFETRAMTAEERQTKVPGS